MVFPYDSYVQLIEYFGGSLRRSSFVLDSGVQRTASNRGFAVRSSDVVVADVVHTVRCCSQRACFPPSLISVS